MSETFTIHFDEGKTEFRPGETISGTITWYTPPSAESIVLRLYWFTSGRGTQDIGVVQKRTWPASFTGSAGCERFAFVLPDEPYSFSGTYISLTWALKIIALPNEESFKKDFVVSPTGKEIGLDNIRNAVNVSWYQKIWE